MKDILTTKHQQILDDVTAINNRMRQLEQEHAERIAQLHQLKGAQAIIEDLLMQAEQAEAEARARAEELEKAPSLEELVATVPVEQERAQPKPFAVGDRVARSRPTGSAARDLGTVAGTQVEVEKYPIRVEWGDGVYGYYSEEELTHV